jgi:predicted metal-binding protein
MLRAVESAPQVVVCNTCRSPAASRDELAGGARLARLLRGVRAADPALAGIAIEEMSCLFACSHSCAVHIRAPGRIGYVLGDFEPDAEAARAILVYARLHAESAEGEVGFADWPEGVKGHFITRTPPEGFIVT